MRFGEPRTRYVELSNEPQRFSKLRHLETLCHRQKPLKGGEDVDENMYCNKPVLDKAPPLAMEYMPD